MKTTILIATLLLSVSIFAAVTSLRVETVQIYGTFQDDNIIKTYKFKDGNVTCYGQIYKSSTGIISSQALSCVN